MRKSKNINSLINRLTKNINLIDKITSKVLKGLLVENLIKKELSKFIDTKDKAYRNGSIYNSELENRFDDLRQFDGIITKKKISKDTLNISNVGIYDVKDCFGAIEIKKSINYSKFITQLNQQARQLGILEENSNNPLRNNWLVIIIDKKKNLDKYSIWPVAGHPRIYTLFKRRKTGEYTPDSLMIKLLFEDIDQLVGPKTKELLLTEDERTSLYSRYKNQLQSLSCSLKSS